MLREIVLDTETTGLDAGKGDRIIEIGAIELYNHIPSGRNFHSYIDPQRPVSAGAKNVHGLDDAFLHGKPLFADIAEEFLAFIGDCPLVIHNASFDTGFLNMELARIRRAPLEGARIIDTLEMARKLLPGGAHSLDALCARFSIDNSARTVHGALLDCELLAAVYIEMKGGRQTGLDLTPPRTPGPGTKASTKASAGPHSPPHPALGPAQHSAQHSAGGPHPAPGGEGPGGTLHRTTPCASRLTPEEIKAHDAFLKDLSDDLPKPGAGEGNNPARLIWHRYIS